MLQVVLNKAHSRLYRISTIFHSLKTLYTLPQEKIEAFFGAYDIFDYDWSDEERLIEKFGVNYYQEMQKKLVEYYSVLNHLCALGQVEKMYIPPALDLSKGFQANQVMAEKKICFDLNIKSSDQVLDIGCGRGRIAAHIASLTGAHVTGINIDQNQLKSAKQFAQETKNLSQRLTFKLADMNDLPLPFVSNAFDAVYEFGALSYAKNLTALAHDIYRILKPGGKFALLDWAVLNYSSDNPEHRQLMKQVKPLIGAIGNPSIKDYETSFQEAGFKILKSENPSIDGLQAPLIENVDRNFNHLTRFIRILVTCKILPKYFQFLFDRFIQDGQAFVNADRKRLVTSCYYMITQK